MKKIKSKSTVYINVRTEPVSFENKNINEGIMELILAVSAMKKSGAASVTAIIPFFPYSTASSALHTY